MFSVMFVLYEREGSSRAEALRYWKETHGPLVAKVPGVRRYVQEHAVGAPEGEPPFLGSAILEFDDAEAFGRAAASSEMAAAVEDVANFADAARLAPVFVEHVKIVG